MCGPDNRCQGSGKNEEKPSMKRKTFLTLKNETNLENDYFEKNKLKEFMTFDRFSLILLELCFTGIGTIQK